MGFPGGSVSKESACNAGHLGSIPGLGRSPGEGNGNPLQALLPGKTHGQRSLIGYSPWGCKELDTTEWLHFQGGARCWEDPRRHWLPNSKLENGPQDVGILKSYVTHMQLRHHRYLEDSFSWDDDNESLCLKEEREQVTMQEVGRVVSSSDSSVPYHKALNFSR